VVNELRLHKSTDGGRTFTSVAVPHDDNHASGSTTDDPKWPSVQRRRRQRHAGCGRSWSSILNQPTAEIYMVSVDERSRT